MLFALLVVIAVACTSGKSTDSAPSVSDETSGTPPASHVAPTDSPDAHNESHQQRSLVSLGLGDNPVLLHLAADTTPIDGRSLAQDALANAESDTTDDQAHWAKASEVVAVKLRDVDVVVADLSAISVSQADTLIARAALSHSIALVLANATPDAMAVLTGSAGLEANFVVLRRKSSGGYEVRAWGHGEPLEPASVNRVITEIEEALNAPL